MIEKIIFLDIDGVLNCASTRERLDERDNSILRDPSVDNFKGGIFGMQADLVERFNYIVRMTGAKVVLSSVWRHADNWLDIMKRNGLAESMFLGRTPQLGNAIRGAEIEMWLQKNGYPERYAILDDDSDMLPNQPLFKTSWQTGLTEEIAKKVIDYLGYEF